jgi:gamma-glutamyltranspeptidase/glutathione hydrolase
MRSLKSAIAALLITTLGLAPLDAPAGAASPLPVGAEHGMIVSAHRLATQAGLDVLKHGGNAVDAAVAVGYALAVTFPEAGNIGGGGFMTIRFHDGRTTFIDFRETAPMAATATLYQDAQGNVIPGLSTRGYRAVGIPGTVAGLELARTKYGTRSRAILMAAAIHLARDGFALDQGDADFLAEGSTTFARMRRPGRSSPIMARRGRRVRNWSRPISAVYCSSFPTRARVPFTRGRSRLASSLPRAPMAGS